MQVWVLNMSCNSDQSFSSLHFLTTASKGEKTSASNCRALCALLRTILPNLSMRCFWTDLWVNSQMELETHQIKSIFTNLQ